MEVRESEGLVWPGRGVIWDDCAVASLPGEGAQGGTDSRCSRC